MRTRKVFQLVVEKLDDSFIVALTEFDTTKVIYSVECDSFDEALDALSQKVTLSRLGFTE